MAELKKVKGGDGSIQLQIIFIHGLGGDPRSTWMHDPSVFSAFWPDWIAHDCNVDVWIYGYGAHLSAWKDNQMPLPSHGDVLLDSINSEPSLAGKPLLLIGHSLGGLVIKSAIVNGITKGVDRYVALIERIQGVVFIATPHNGSHLANVARAIAFVLKTNESLEDLKIHNAHIRNLHQQFLAVFKDGNISARSYAETEGIFLGKRIFGLRLGRELLVVDPDSSEPHIPNEFVIPVPENHFSICKPRSRDSLIHRSISGFINEVINGCLDEKIGHRVCDELEPEKSWVCGVFAGSPQIQNAARKVVESSKYPSLMFVKDMLVPNPVWSPIEATDDERETAFQITDVLQGEMLLAVNQPRGEVPHLLCYWSARWRAYLIPFHRIRSGLSDSREQRLLLEEHVRQRYDGFVYPTNEFMISVKRNEELPDEFWLYVFRFHNLVIPEGFQLSPNYKWLTLDRLTDPRKREAAVNGDVLRGVRSYFSQGLHNLKRSSEAGIDQLKG